MQGFMVKPTIYNYQTAEEFAKEFQLGEGDLILTNEYIYNPFFGKMNLQCDVSGKIWSGGTLRRYGRGNL